MRILQISSAEVLGGGEVHVIELTQMLRERGHTVRMAGRGNGPLDLDFKLPFLNSADLYTAYRLRRLVRRERFDIVHAHVARDYPIAAAALLGLADPKLVLTRQLIFAVRRNPSYSRVDGWIVTTDQILQSIQHLRPRASVIIPNWVDSGKLTYEERGLQKPVTVGLLGQVSPHKGHDDAIEAVRLLGPGFRLLLGGEGKPDYVRSLRDRARDLPVEFLGFVKPASFLERVDMLIVPSWQEPFGIVILEAMAAGVNVIATNAGGPPEILDFGKAGLLIQPRDPVELASAVRRLGSDENLRRNLRARALARIHMRYDISIAVPQIEDFYHRLCVSVR